ncbi:TM2 domain-containing protein [uncultured Maribacter sp.]|uniref:TM2 domain-containing protein n=1 Tax=uncultured Maribacter sp. TaxID=431308 RepID=UPI002622BDFF|nr:TM2 domain-containing protein [uncultured Maribacter sp.]
MSEENKNLGDKAEDALDSAKDKAKDIGENASEKFEEAKESAKEFAEDAKEKASEFAEEAKEAAGDFADEAKKTANEFADSAKEAFGSAGGENKKVLAGLLAIFIGSLGIHKFILGYPKEGIIQLVATFITFGFAGIIPLIEGIIYLTKSDEEFYNTYQVGKKPWF